MTTTSCYEAHEVVAQDKHITSPFFVNPIIPLSLAGAKKSSKKTLLPRDFTPTAYSVICGRRKECFDSVGNRGF